MMKDADPNFDELKLKVANLKPSIIARICFRFFGYRKKIVMNNLAQAFGQVLTLFEREQIARAFYGHLLKSIKENLALTFMRPSRIKAKAIVQGHEKVIEAVEKNKGVIILTGHFGNWEFGPIAGMMNFPEFQHRIAFIRRQQSVEWIGNFLFRRFRRAGLGVITQGNSLHSVCDLLEQNQGIVFVMDQHPPLGSKDGILVDFFGKKAGTYRSVASLVRYTGVPVIPASTYRDESGKHVLAFYDPLPWIHDADPKQEIYLNTLSYNQAIEKMIIDHPEQWLWLYKRWKVK